MAFSLSSPAFKQNAPIPMKFAVDGDNESPPLVWRDAPAATRSFVLLVEDPDAPSGLFRHWAAYDIPADTTELREGASGMAEAINDFGHTGYDGPKPPRGDGPHHYHFRLAALDTDRLGVGPRAKAGEVWRKAEPHILAEADLVGIYETP